MATMLAACATFARAVSESRPVHRAAPDDDAPGGGTGPDDGSGGDPGRDDDGWVTVATFWASEPAHLARLCLESNGLDCVLLDEYLVSTDWLLANAAGGIKLQVLRRRAAQARAILDAAHCEGAAQLTSVEPGRADRLADWVANHLRDVSRRGRRWLSRLGRGWWVGALLPAALAGPVPNDYRGPKLASSAPLAVTAIPTPAA